MKWFDNLLYYILFPVVAITALFAPTTNDVRIFASVEYLAHTFGQFPQAISYYWEMKPLGGRLLYYILTEFTQWIVPFSNHVGTDMLLKAVAVIAAICASWYFSRTVLKTKHSFLLCFFGLMICVNVNILQYEWWATVFAMISCAMLVSERTYLHYLAGALSIMTLLVKGTSGCLVITAICVVVLLYEKKPDWARALIGFVTTGLAFFVASQTIWPEMLPDIFLAPMISHVLEYSMMNQAMVTLVAIGVSFPLYIPVAGLGAVAAAMWIRKNISLARGLPFAVMWLAPMATVWLQTESFPYHYFIFVLPAIVSLVLYENETPLIKPGKKLPRENWIVYTVCILFIGWCALFSPWSYFGVQETNLNKYFTDESNNINSRFDFSNEPVLYMDGGVAPYYFQAESACRYISPLVLQRSNEQRDLTSNPANIEEYTCAMNYSGRYIIADGQLGGSADDLPGYNTWFGNNTVQKQTLIFKIKSEYDIVYQSGWFIWERRGLPVRPL